MRVRLQHGVLVRGTTSQPVLCYSVGMRPRRSLLLLILALLLLAGVALAAWALHPNRYPYPVYYQRETLAPIGSNAPPVLFEEWIDLRRGIVRGEVRIGHDHAHLYIHTALQYFSPGAGSELGRAEPLDPQQARYYAWLFAALARGGYRGVGEALLAQRTGPIARLRFGGRAAVRFASAAPAVTGGSSVAWLETRSLEPLQILGSSTNFAPPSIERFSRTARLPPGSLPDGFLDLPRTERSAWDRALDWLRARLGRQR